MASSRFLTATATPFSSFTTDLPSPSISLLLSTTLGLRRNSFKVNAIATKYKPKRYAYVFSVQIFEFYFSFIPLSLRAKQGSNVLDLCCGSGDLAFLLSEKVGLIGQIGCSLFPLSSFLHSLAFPPKFSQLPVVKRSRNCTESPPDSNHLSSQANLASVSSLASKQPSTAAMIHDQIGINRLSNPLNTKR
ncbi:hypothetical protein L6452_22777 [Arctium lappa]|uniref:Uncharacterized protein n=1 Tax=Arctium lappa TaxID=4217 RepID=A0ACB9B0U0_ARCLA|nr:hypothetical protein L6452_22777 [Arctium lappa]